MFGFGRSEASLSMIPRKDDGCGRTTPLRNSDSGRAKRFTGSREMKRDELELFNQSSNSSTSGELIPRIIPASWRKTKSLGTSSGFSNVQKAA